MKAVFLKAFSALGSKDSKFGKILGFFVSGENNNRYVTLKLTAPFFNFYSKMSVKANEEF